MECPLCVAASGSSEWMQVHCVSAHPKEFFTCPWCIKPFSSLRMLQKHAANCTALDKNEPREGNINMVLVNGNTCLVCEGRFSSKEATINHYKEQHLNFSYICDVCGMYFQRRISMDLHYVKCRTKSTKPSTSVQSADAGDIHKNNKKRAALVAFNEVGANVADSSKKVSKVSDANRESCTADPSSAVNAMVYKRLLLKNASLLLCTGCNSRFTNANEIRDHFETVHKLKAFFCDGCNNAYATKSNMYRHAKQCKGHLRDNVPEAPVEANHGTSRKQQSKVDKPKVFNCYLCDFTSTSRIILSAHVNGHFAKRVKTEIGAASSSNHVNGIKQELHENGAPLNDGPKSSPIFLGIEDLTGNDD